MLFFYEVFGCMHTHSRYAFCQMASGPIYSVPGIHQKTTPLFFSLFIICRRSPGQTSITHILCQVLGRKLKNVSCEYDRWVVETQLCKLRGTSDTLIGLACAMVQLKYGVRELLIYDMVYYAQYVRRKKRPKESKRG